MNSKIKLLLIIFLLASPLFASYLTYYFWKPTHSINYGELLPTKLLPLEGLQSMNDAGGAAALKGKWVLLTVDSGNCAATCQEKLYLMRQIRTAQGKYMDRIARALVIDDDVPFNRDAMKEYEGTVVLKGGPQVVDQLKSTDDIHGHTFLIDPLGNLVLRYPPNPNPKRMMKDLTRLLSVSSVE